jgi:plastocyanin
MNALKFIYSFILFITLSISAKATIHVINVWDGYFQFVPTEITIQLGDTIQWLPLDSPAAVHTITSTDIPVGAEEFDQIWQTPADTFFQYVPQYVGVYNYVCTPHEISFNMIGSFTVEGANTIKENSLSSFILSPNPATNYISFGDENTGLPYKIFGLDGKEYLSGYTEKEIDISSLQNEAYLIQIISTKTEIFRFIKQ